MSAETRLVRAGRGKDTIHRRGCRFATISIPWVWAEERSDLEVYAAANANGLRLCKVCDPTASKP